MREPPNGGGEDGGPARNLAGRKIRRGGAFPVPFGTPATLRLQDNDLTIRGRSATKKHTNKKKNIPKQI